MSNVLEVRELSKQYQDFYLDHISFDIAEKEIVGFIGTNGSGKSTTIKSILGLINCEYDAISYFGKRFDKNDKSIKDKLGVVLDDGYFYDNLTLEEMKSIVAPAYQNWEEEIFQKLLKRFKLNKKQKLETLSKGMKMKYSIALALAHHAKLIIMDEPTSGLDPLVRSELMDVLRNVVDEEGCSIIFSTHIISDLDKIADKILFIEQGKLVFEKNKQSLIEEYKVKLSRSNISIEDIMLYHEKGGKE